MAKYDKLLRPRETDIQQDASFWRRLFAFVFDLLVLDVIIAMPFTPIFESMVSRAEGVGFLDVAYTSRELGALLLLFALFYCYFLLFEYLLGQTPGMMLLDIRVEGSSSLAPLALRNSFIFPVFPFVVFWLVEPIAIIFWRRGVLEYLSRTRTVHRKRVIL